VLRRGLTDHHDPLPGVAPEDRPRFGDEPGGDTCGAGPDGRLVRFQPALPVFDRDPQVLRDSVRHRLP